MGHKYRNTILFVPYRKRKYFKPLKIVSCYMCFRIFNSEQDGFIQIFCMIFGSLNKIPVMISLYAYTIELSQNVNAFIYCTTVSNDVPKTQYFIGISKMRNKDFQCFIIRMNVTNDNDSHWRLKLLLREYFLLL